MALRSHHLNGHSWDIFPLAEHVLQFTLTHRTEQSTSICRNLARAIESMLKEGITEVVSSYDSVAVFYDPAVYDRDTLLQSLNKLTSVAVGDFTPVTHEIPVCYELGIDWDRVEHETGNSKDAFIEMHCGSSYEVAMLGFLPGFIFLDGLNKKLACDRLDHPRSAVPAGSVGIGGGQTGLYSLSTPGGWNIIGRTPYQLFKPERQPPVLIRAGDHIVFRSISRQDFDHLNEHEQGPE